MNSFIAKITNSINSGESAFCKFIARNEVGDTGGHQMGFYVPKEGASVIFETPGLRGENKDKFVTIRWNDRIETQSRFIYYGKGTRNEYRITRFGKNFPYLRSDQVGNLFILVKRGEVNYDAFVVDNEDDITQLTSIFDIPRDKLLTGLLVKGNGFDYSLPTTTEVETSGIDHSDKPDNVRDSLESEEYTFQPGARAIIQMGEELIGHPTTAVNELVKNSYDADATECRVYFHFDIDTSSSFIIIQDNGLGMSHDILFGEWLQPSMSHKRRGNGKSQIFERNLLGSKGIGRLAVMALGKYLTVISKTREEEHYNWLCLDRDRFKKEGLLENVRFPGGQIKHLGDLFDHEKIIQYKGIQSNPSIASLAKKETISGFSEGTLVIIEVVDESVRLLLQDDVNNPELSLNEIVFFNSLRVLITPLEQNADIQDELVDRKLIGDTFSIAKESSVFSVMMGTNLVPELTGKFVKIEAANILTVYDYRVMGRITTKGDVIGYYDCKRLVEDSLESEFKLTREETLSEEVAIKKRKDKTDVVPENKEHAEVGEFFFDIRVYDRDNDSMEKMAKVLKTTGKRQTGFTLDKLLGLRISKNGFGVKPYGSEDKDWMSLGQMRVQNPTATLGINQILGNIFLHSPMNDGLSEKTNREGFFENEAFINFKKILRAILLEAGKRRYRYRVKHNIGRTTRSKLQRPDSAKFLAFIKKNTDDTKLITRTEEFIAETNTSLENMENSLSFSQRLASLGSGLELVYHELAQPITQMGGATYNIKVHSNKISKEEIRQLILAEVARIDSSADTLDELKESLLPAIGRSMPANFIPVETFRKVCSLFASDFEEELIEVNYDSELDDYSIKDYEYIFWISFLNIINNAIYWLKSDKENTDKRININRIENGICISNTGPSIPENDIETIFDYGVTLRKEKNATGLGLSYTQSMLSSIDWEITARNTEDGPQFLITKKL